MSRYPSPPLRPLGYPVIYCQVHGIPLNVLGFCPECVKVYKEAKKSDR